MNRNERNAKLRKTAVKAAFSTNKRRKTAFLVERVYYGENFYRFYRFYRPHPATA